MLRNPNESYYKIDEEIYNLLVKLAIAVDNNHPERILTTAGELRFKIYHYPFEEIKE